MSANRIACVVVCAAGLLAWAGPALAQDDGEEAAALDEVPAEEVAADSESAEGAEAAAPKDKESEAAVAAALDTGVTETKGQTYLFVGARYRTVFIPQFIQGLFAEGGATAVAHHPGAEFGIRQDGFEYSIFAMLGFYQLSDTAFKGKSDPIQAWEIINADFKILYVGSDFMWSTDEFAPGLSMHYGAGVGLGLVFGSLGRVQAYPELGSNPGDAGNYRKCTAPNNPNFEFCNTDNDHYGSYTESSPTPVFPWIAGQIGLRYKLHRHFVARIDAGIMVPGAFIGIGADYGL